MSVYLYARLCLCACICYAYVYSCIPSREYLYACLFYIIRVLRVLFRVVWSSSSRFFCTLENTHVCYTFKLSIACLSFRLIFECLVDTLGRYFSHSVTHASFPFHSFSGLPLNPANLLNLARQITIPYIYRYFLYPVPNLAGYHHSLNVLSHHDRRILNGDNAVSVSSKVIPSETCKRSLDGHFDLEKNPTSNFVAPIHEVHVLFLRRYIFYLFLFFLFVRHCV